MINEARRVIEARLNSIKTTYNIAEISYRLASEDAMYPHIVWDFTTMSPTEQGRRDATFDVHVWSRDQFEAFQIADAVIDLFAYANVPQADILPTFYETSVFPADDPDKSIVHVVARLEGQMYLPDAQFGWKD